ncbi:hypothetical protein [Rubrimonas cliftonensis]|uniref:Quinol monooxygenase YgiN n=1 Tax=Rubrimonas cliftonensis TaxID=89524 RepID=A0A1H4G131_9RHOB|nr:hypothetical protein [Rubrimonas cliftonensis]SEB03336.1 hypothetical protein SAMN05444370_1342 [Rubrimonas cliftonensis]
MFVSIRRYRGVASAGALLRAIEAEFAPRLRAQPGFVAYYALDEGDGAFTTVSVFSTAAMAADTDAIAAAWLREQSPADPPVPVETAAGRLAVALPPVRG